MGNVGSERHLRSDVQGLRAISVIAVFLFHFSPGEFVFGFLGVDVFAVISGFVVSAVILREISETGRFRPGLFVHRRARRLIPVLIVVVGVTLIAWFIFSPADVHGEALIAGISSLLIGANIFFYRQSTDYFFAQETPFLHLWSLSMEEQFYLLLIGGVVLGLYLRRRMRSLIRLASLAVAVAVASPAVLVGALILWRVMPLDSRLELNNALFYFPIGRAWQFLAGVAVALAVRSRQTSLPLLRSWLVNLLSVALMLILVSVSGNSSDFLSWQRIAVTYLVAVLIYINTQNPQLGWFAKQPFVAIGDRSYSIYLWHVPVIALWKVHFGTTPSLAVAIALTMILTELTYRSVELPFRSRAKSGSVGKSFVMIGVVLVFVAVSALVFEIPERIIAQTQQLPNAPYSLDDRWSRIAKQVPRDECNEDEYFYSCGVLDETIDVILVGDSHAMALSHVFLDTAYELNLRPYVQVASGCYFLGSPTLTLENVEYPTACEILNRTLQIEIERLGTPIVVSECPRTRFESCPDPGLFERTKTIISTRRANLGNAVASGVKVLIIQELPIVIDDLRRRQTLFNSLIGSESVSKQPIDVRYEGFRRTFREDESQLESEYPDSIQLMDPSEVLCGDLYCAGLTVEGKPVWADEDHLTVDGAGLLRDQLAAAMRRLVRPQDS